MEKGEYLVPEEATSAHKLIEFNKVEFEDDNEKESFERIAGILSMTFEADFAPFCAFLGGVAT